MKKALLIFTIMLAGCSGSDKSQRADKPVEKHSVTDGRHTICYTTIQDAENQIYDYEQNNYTVTGEKSWDMFKDLIVKDPRAYEYDFPKLGDLLYIDICYSPDKKVKFYSWDESTGTMTMCNGITSFMAGKKIITDTTANVSYGIYETAQVKANNGEDIYIALSYSQDYGSCRYQMIDAYKIADSRIVNAYVFERWSHDSRMIMNYSPGSFFANIEYQDGVIYIPETEENIHPYARADISTGRSHKFKWNGRYFENLGIDYTQNRNLCTDLLNFEKNIIHITLGNWIVRIDEMPDGDYRYAAWRASSSTTSKPSLILHNGSDYSYGYYHEYIFTNYGHEYIVTWNNEFDYIDEATLVVTKYGEVILTATE